MNLTALMAMAAQKGATKKTTQCLIAYSRPSLHPIPDEACHPFHTKAATYSSESCHP